MGYERKEYKGNAAPTTITGTIDADDLSVTIADATNWPTGGANGKFVIVIGRATAFEEKLLCSSRTGTSLMISSRGHDGTTQQGHTAGAVVEHVLDAESMDQVNRFANLLTTKGDLIAHNGVNPVRLGTGPVDADDDGKVLQLSFAEATGMIFDAVQSIILAASAPIVDGPVRMWFDETVGIIRPSDGSSWLTPSQFPAFATRAAATSYFNEVAGIAYFNTTLGFGEVYDGDTWIPMQRPIFVDSAARDAYYSSPYDGAQAYLTGSHEEQVYRYNEWITISQEFTVAASAPASPQVGDIWLQPVG